MDELTLTKHITMGRPADLPFADGVHCFVTGELLVGVRKSETVTLRDPVMPVTDGFNG